MKKHWIQYTPDRRPGPMTYWVHIATNRQGPDGAREYDPPLPAPVPGRGYATYIVEFDSAELRFASLDELRLCIRTLSEKHLPSNLRLTDKHGTGYGPSNHWLNRIPLRSMAWPYRCKVTRYLKTALGAFERGRT